MPSEKCPCLGNVLKPSVTRAAGLKDEPGTYERRIWLGKRYWPGEGSCSRIVKGRRCDALRRENFIDLLSQAPGVPSKGLVAKRDKTYTHSVSCGTHAVPYGSLTSSQCLLYQSFFLTIDTHKGQNSN